MNTIVKYLLEWLVGDPEAARRIGYTSDAATGEGYDLVIRPNGHLGKDWVLPDLREPVVEGQVVEVDLVYNTAFFVSRAEELLNPLRDRHGRFLAQYSLLGEGERLQRPLLDDYRQFLRRALGLPPEEPGFSRIWLTHDLDSIDRYRHLRGIAGGLRRGELGAMVRSWTHIENDPVYTFPWFLKQEGPMERAAMAGPTEVIYFEKHTTGKGLDYPQYPLGSRRYSRLRQQLVESGATIGLHSSAYGFHGKSPYPLHRSHFLRCDTDNMQRLVDGGVTDDFTMQFPDRCGFRLQTCRPVRWINPRTMELTELMLHPLTVMDCTLSARNYMNLSEDEALAYCWQLFETIKRHRGELVLLWHNIDPADNPYHFTLYPQLLQFLRA